MYEVHIRRRPDLLAALPELAGKRLGCYCKPEACHGDVLVKLLGELFFGKVTYISVGRIIPMNTQTLFSGKWVPTKPLPISKPRQPTLRRSQARAFAALKDKERVLLQAPTGWGKSLLIASLVLYKLLRNPDLRCIIAVPQTLIARGFVRDWKLRIAGRLVDWIVQHNLCHKQATDILPDKMLATFTHVKIPYDLYFDEVQPVESFEFNIIAGDTLKALDSIFAKPRPTILYLAKRNSRYAGRCKYLEVKQVVRRLGKRLGAPVRRRGELILVGDLKVLDLVTEKGREARKA